MPIDRDFEIKFNRLCRARDEGNLGEIQTLISANIDIIKSSENYLPFHSLVTMKALPAVFAALIELLGDEAKSFLDQPSRMGFPVINLICAKGSINVRNTGNVDWSFKCCMLAINAGANIRQILEEQPIHFTSYIDDLHQYGFIEKRDELLATIHQLCPESYNIIIRKIPYLLSNSENNPPKEKKGFLTRFSEIFLGCRTTTTATSTNQEEQIQLLGSSNFRIKKHL